MKIAIIVFRKAESRLSFSWDPTQRALTLGDLTPLFLTHHSSSVCANSPPVSPLLSAVPSQRAVLVLNPRWCCRLHSCLSPLLSLLEAAAFSVACVFNTDNVWLKFLTWWGFWQVILTWEMHTAFPASKRRKEQEGRRTIWTMLVSNLALLPHPSATFLIVLFFSTLFQLTVF